MISLHHEYNYYSLHLIIQLFLRTVHVIRHFAFLYKHYSIFTRAVPRVNPNKEFDSLPFIPNDHPPLLFIS